jgi:hypothetical protein
VRDVDDLIFSRHARDEMSNHSVTEDEVYHVVGDHDEAIEYDNGRMEYVRTMEDGRTIVVIIENDDETVVTVWQRKWRRPRRR